jgi:hypothetical protein
LGRDNHRVRLLLAALAVAVAIGALAGGCGDDSASAPRVDRFDSERAFAFLEGQVALGPRPAGSRASRRLARRLRRALPHSRYQRVPGGLRNVIGKVPGRDPDRLIVV